MSLVISPVDFGIYFYEAHGILANSCETYQSRVDSRKCFIKAEWILANVLPSRVDSRKCFIEPSGFWRNLLQNQVDFRQTFISQTDSLQVFSLIRKSHSQCV